MKSDFSFCLGSFVEDKTNGIGLLTFPSWLLLVLDWAPISIPNLIPIPFLVHSTTLSSPSIYISTSEYCGAATYFFNIKNKLTKLYVYIYIYIPINP